MAQTVIGPVAVADLGITSMHEHLWMDSTALASLHGYAPAAQGPWTASVAAEARWNPGVHPDNYRLDDEDAVIEELSWFTTAGGGTIVEVTPPGLGRDPARVRAIAERAGIKVVLGGGQYVEPAHEAWVAEATEAEIATRLVAEAIDGIGESGVRIGILGEIGTLDPVRRSERRILRAAAAAGRETGLAISVHVHPWSREAAAVLDELMAAGANPARVVLGHMSTSIGRPDELRALADRGAVLGFDLFGFDHSLLGPGRWPPSDRDVAVAMLALIQEGHRDRIVAGQDVGVRTRFRRWGGWGYAHLLDHVVPLLRGLGAGEDDLHAILIENPARLLTVPTASTMAGEPGGLRA